MNVNKVQNLCRYWVDKDSKIVVRKWTDEEYKNTNPNTHIFEKYWSYRCPICSFIPTPHISEQEAKHGANTHLLYAPSSRHKCVIEYRFHELVCYEYKEEFIEGIGVWNCKYTYYD